MNQQQRVKHNLKIKNRRHTREKFCESALVCHHSLYFFCTQWHGKVTVGKPLNLNVAKVIKDKIGIKRLQVYHAGRFRWL